MNVRRGVQEPEQQRQNSQHRDPPQPASGQWVFQGERCGHDAAEYVTQLQLMRDGPDLKPGAPRPLRSTLGGVGAITDSNCWPAARTVGTPTRYLPCQSGFA